MSYNVIYNRSVQKYLEKMDSAVSLRITAWIEKNLAGCEDPRSVGRYAENMQEHGDIV